MITKQQLQSWRSDAQKATQGNYHVSGEKSWSVKTNFAPWTISFLSKLEDARHIANLCPTNAIVLIDALNVAIEALQEILDDPINNGAASIAHRTLEKIRGAD